MAEQLQPEELQGADYLGKLSLEDPFLKHIIESFDGFPTPEDVLKAIKNTNPLAKSRGTELQEMVKWAAENAVNASRVEDKEKASETTTGGRQLDLE